LGTNFSLFKAISADSWQKNIYSLFPHIFFGGFFNLEIMQNFIGFRVIKNRARSNECKKEHQPNFNNRKVIEPPIAKIEIAKCKETAENCCYKKTP